MSTYEDPRDGGVEIIGEQTEITFEYEQPNVSVDTNARFIEHEVIGGMTVRQKVGEEPMEINVDGICTRGEARLIDNLYEETTVEFNSYRTGVVIAQVVSTSTDPYDDGGAVAVFDNEDEDSSSDTIYTFSISLVEV